MQIRDVAAFVTGGGSGLGRAAAEWLARAGARVSIADVNSEAGEAVASQIGGLYSPLDVTDDAGVAEAIERAEKAHGVARLLINCAGLAPAARIVDKSGRPHDLSVFRRTIDVNIIGTFNMMSKFAARLAAAEVPDEEVGVIINTASVAAFDGQIGQAAYAASKAAVAGLTLPAARDLAQHRIRVVAIAPGIFLTPMMSGFPPEVQDSLGRQVPHPSRLGRPDEFAHLVGAIIGNTMLNGEIIRLDGAIRMAPR